MFVFMQQSHGPNKQLALENVLISFDVSNKETMLSDESDVHVPVHQSFNM